MPFQPGKDHVDVPRWICGGNFAASASHSGDGGAARISRARRFLDVSAVTGAALGAGSGAVLSGGSSSCQSVASWGLPRERLRRPGGGAAPVVAAATGACAAERGAST